jgi:hypothetical protein
MDGRGIRGSILMELNNIRNERMRLLSFSRYIRYDEKR